MRKGPAMRAISAAAAPRQPARPGMTKRSEPRMFGIKAGQFSGPRGDSLEDLPGAGHSSGSAGVGRQYPGPDRARSHARTNLVQPFPPR